MSRPESLIAWDLAISFKQVGVGFRVKSLGFDPKTLHLYYPHRNPQNGTPVLGTIISKNPKP